VVAGVFTQRWEVFRPRGTRLRRRNAELERSLQAERLRADRLAEELGRARAEFERTLSRVNDLFWTVEVLPDGEVTLVHLSADASGVIGTDVPEGLDALAFREGLGHPDDTAVNAAFTQAIREGRPAEVEERLVGYDGVTRWTWSRGTPRREGGRLFFDGLTTNITERHELAAQREALLAREREQVAMLEEMHRSRDDFVALAGHELRTPLTVIQGYAEHLLDDPATTPEQAQQLEIVVRRARSMSDLIDDLFDLATLGAPLSAIAFAPVDLHEVVEESLQAHEPSARQRNLTLRTTLEPVQVVGDRARLRRMCDTVLDNAVTYSPAGGEITVILAREDRDAVLVVADQGAGIPQDDLPHVFERLYRGSNAVNSRIPGTGLGLSIVLATAEALGGAATATNGDGGGAVFTIRLPAREVADSPADR
jgi:signal transduction histidine kinase